MTGDHQAPQKEAEGCTLTYTVLPSVPQVPLTTMLPLLYRPENGMSGAKELTGSHTAPSGLAGTGRQNLPLLNSMSCPLPNALRIDTGKNLGQDALERNHQDRGLFNRPLM